MATPNDPAKKPAAPAPQADAPPADEPATADQITATPHAGRPAEAFSDKVTPGPGAALPGRQVRLWLLFVGLMALAGVIWWTMNPDVREFFRKRMPTQPGGANYLPSPQPRPENPPRASASADFAPHQFDWPQWRGPERTAISRETALLQDWPKEGPTLLWQADYAGEGYSTPTVAGGRVFLMGNRGDSEYVFALSEEDGGQLWSAAVGPVRGNGSGYPGPRSSPAVDGDRAYALGINGDLLCLDATTGREKWRRDLRQDFHGTVGAWGYCESPLIDGDELICTPGGASATIVALNKDSGDLIWQCPVKGSDPASYASAIAIDLGGQRQYVQFLNGGLVGVSREGKFLWRYARPANGTAVCSTPLFHDGAVFGASGYRAGGALAKLDPKNVEPPQEVYHTIHMQNHHGGMVLIEGYIYGANGDLLTCLDWKTGTVKWSERRAGKGSISAADGRIYYRNESGPMFLVEINPEKYIEHGRFEPPKKVGPAWPHPVIANGKLFLRDQEYLFCYDVKQK